MLRQNLTRSNYPHCHSSFLSNQDSQSYIAFIDNITIYHDYALGLGRPRQRPISIPQGCPFSMRFLALMIAPWIKVMEVQGSIPRALADDLATFATEPQSTQITTASMHATFEYLNAFGGKVRANKTWAFAPTKAARDDLATITFPYQRHIPLDVVHEHRDLGGHLDFTEGLAPRSRRG